MGYYDTVLAALPFTSYKLNSAETGYADISGRAGVFTGTPVFAPSILAGASKSLSVTGGTTYDITTSVFKKGNESSPFTLNTWFAPLTFQVGSLSIMSHTGVYDGLMFDGDFIKFRLRSSLNNYLETSWPIPDLPKAYMVTGRYNTQKIQLLINGVVVSEAEVTDEFRTWNQETSSNLFLGQSATAYKAAADGMTTFAYALTDAQVLEMYTQGRDVLPTVDVVGAYGGSYWDGTQRAISLQKEWIANDWLDGISSNVSATDGSLRPQNDFSTGLSLAGTWQGTLQVGVTELTAAGGVLLEWDGDGSFLVEASLNGGTTWSAVSNGRLIPNTFPLNTTTTPIIDLRVTFTGGVASDISAVRRLRATVFTDALLLGDDNSRTLTLTNNVSTSLEYNEPIERSMNSGLNFYGGTLTMSADTTTSPRNIGAIEFYARVRSSATSGTGGYFFDSRAGGGTAYMWIPTASNLLSWGGTGSVFVNGAVTTSASYTMRYNEWVHVLVNFSTPFNTPIVIGGGNFDGQISRVTTYPAALTTAQTQSLYQSYVKTPVARLDDTAGVITLAEPATPVNLYAYSWEATNV